MSVISVRLSRKSFMLKARFSRPLRLGQYPTLSSPRRIQSHPLHARGIKGDSESSTSRGAQDKPASETTMNGNHTKVPVSAYDLDINARMWEWTKQASINLKHCADDFTAKSKSTFSQLGCWLNQLTGYEEIEALKRGVAKQGMS
jgi:sensitive to high expression protein 9